MRRRLTLIVSTLAVAVLLVGCGSDDDSSDDGGDPTTTDVSTTTEGDETTDSTDAPTESTEDTTVEDPDDTEPSDTTAPAGDTEAFCAAYDTFGSTADELPNETIEDIRAGATTLKEAFESVRAVAPAELADAVDALTEALAQLEQIANDSATIEDAQTAYTEAFGSEDAQNSAEAVDSYFDTNCPQANDDQASTGETAPAEGE
jgi:hypothetical protein